MSDVTAKVWRVVGIFALTSFLPLAALTFASLSLAERAVRQEVNAGLVSTAGVGAAAVQHEVEGLQQVVSSYAARRLLREALAGEDPGADEASITRILSELRQVRDGLITTFIVDPPGRLVDVQPATDRTLSEDLSSREWYKRVEATRRPYVSSVYASENGQQQVVAVAAPVSQTDDPARLLGITVAEYSVEAIERFAEEIVSAQTWNLTVFDQRGVELAPDSPAQDRPDGGGDRGVREALRGSSGTVTRSGPRGDVLAAYAPVEGLRWAVIASVDEDIAFAGVARLRSVVFTVAGTFALVLCAGLAFMVFMLRARYRAEEELSASEHRFSELVEALPVGLFVRTADGQPYLANQEAHRLLGKGAERVTPQRLADERELFVAGTRERYPTERMPIVRALKGESAMVEDMEIRRDDVVVPLEVRGAPIRDAEGRLMYAVAMFTDITERRQAQEAVERAREESERATGEAERARDEAERAREEAERAREEAERANRAKNDFLSRMSHELRTPLNAILGFAQLLEMDVETEQDRESVQTILKGGRHLLDLINELLDLARVESGELPISLEVVDVEEALDEAIELVRPVAEANVVTIGRDARGENPHYATADRQRLKQVLLNLLSNAVKYNHEGGTVLVSVADPLPDRVRISVSDTGRGIPEDKLDRVFVPFDRLGAEDGAVEGTGLGLALSRSLVELMDGSIGVDSSLGEGSTFWIELPAAQDAITRVAAASPQPLQDASVLRPARTVLCIEDNVASVRLLERVFEHRPNVAMLAATQGSLGLELAKVHHPDLVLLDLNLPDMHGRDVLERLRHEPATADIPVVVLSADATPGQIQRLMEAGASDYLTKPINVHKCLEVLDEVLEYDAV